MLALHAIDELVVERRHVAVLFRRQSFEPRLARMHGESLHARARAQADHIAQGLLGILIVHADAAFDRDRNGNRVAHRRHAFRHQLRLPHQAGAEASRLHAVRRAADIQIDFGIAEIRADLRGLRQLLRLRSAQLQRHRIFAAVEAQQPLAIAAQDRVRRHHLGVEQGAARELAMEEPAMPVRPVHHGGYAEAMRHGRLLPVHRRANNPSRP